MSKQVNRFCEDLRVQLNALEERVEAAKENIQGLPDKMEKFVHDKVDKARATLHAQKERVEKARADLEAWAEQKKFETQAMVGEWKAKREANKLKARADQAEAYAYAALIVALASIDEAEAAIFDAVAARRDAEAVQ